MEQVLLTYAVFKFQGHCTWASLSGRRVELRPFCLLQITDAERHVLHKIALNRLNALNLGCPIVIPKGKQTYENLK